MVGQSLFSFLERRRSLSRPSELDHSPGIFINKWNHFLANRVAAEVVLIRFGAWIIEGEGGFVVDAVTNGAEVGV